MTRARLAAVLVASVAAGLAARSGRAADEAQPLPSDRKARVDSLFSPYDRSDSPGCALGIFQDGRVAYGRGYGMANLELGVANTPQTVFDIGSLGKQFSAFAILLLERDGKLSQNDDIRRFLPEIPDYGHRVTIAHLLHHTGGLRDYIELLYLQGLRDEDVTSEKDALDALARQTAPLYAPGSEYLYSNSGYFLLGVIVRRASGKSLRDFAEERIFGPLGMTHSQYNEDHARVIPNRSTGYSPRRAGGFGIDMSDFEQNGDGGMLTTIEDLFRWDQNFYEPAVGDPKLLADMQATVALNDGKPIDYALGLRIGSFRGLRTVGHTGSWAGYRALLYRFPDQRFSVVCLCNRSDVDRIPLMRKIAAIYLGDRMQKEPTPAPAAAKTKNALPPAALARYAGAYRDPRSGVVSFLSVEAGELVAEAEGSKVSLHAIAPDRFASQEGDLELRFDRATAGARPRFEALGEEEAPRTFEPIEPWAPTAAMLPGFAGLYTSSEVPALFRFAVVDGKLVLLHRTIPADAWRPTLPDSFSLADDNVTFTRDPSGKVTGFRLNDGRMRGLVFRKIGE